MHRWIPLSAFGIAFSALTLTAHHSLTRIYDGSRRVMLEGDVLEFQFVNPHPFLTLDVSGDTASDPEVWRLELDNRSELSRIGMSSDTLKMRDRIVVMGNPSRSGLRELYVLRLERPADAYGYEQVGNRPQLLGEPR